MDELEKLSGTVAFWAALFMAFVEEFTGGDGKIYAAAGLIIMGLMKR